MPGMKQSTIKKVLRKKLDQWGDSINQHSKANNITELSEDMIRTLKENTMVCGGAITSMLMGEKPNDYDLYFKNKATVLLMSNYYSGRFKKSHGTNITVKQYKFRNIRNQEEDRVGFWIQSAGIASETSNPYRYFECVSEDSITENYFDSLTTSDEGPNPPEGDSIEEGIEFAKEIQRSSVSFRPIFFTDNAVTLANKIQIVIRFYGEAEQIFDTYDYAHNMCSYDYKSDKLFVPATAMEAILSKTLIYQGSLYPVSSIFRMRKFINRGWRITAGQMLKILWQIKDINLDSVPVLRDQLMGVDIAYMSQLISHLTNLPKGTKIDSIYIAKLIDEIFD